MSPLASTRISGRRGKPAAADIPPGLKVLYTAEQIAERVDAMAAAAARILQGTEPLVLCVLKGGFVFGADLIRRLPLPLDVSFIQAESYGSGTVSSGRVRIVCDVPLTEIRGRKVLLIDDIVDTGRTLVSIKRHLASRGAEVVCTSVLLARAGFRGPGAHADLVGFEVGPDFVVGYGLDMAGKYRNLPYLAAVAGKRANV